MASLERRIAQLEDAGPEKWRGHRPGVLTVKLEPFFGRFGDGFILESLDAPAARSTPRGGVSRGLSFESLKAEVKRKTALSEKLEGLDREAQQKLANRHGYRVIYKNDANWRR